jgi:hypothetical protein
MNRTPDTSSNRGSVGDHAAMQTLALAFLDDGLYQYYTVPVGVCHSWCRRVHVGATFTRAKKAGSRYAKVG